MSSHTSAQYYNEQLQQLRIYEPEESGVAEMCHLFCAQAGRGHIHTRLCRNGDDHELCTETYNGRTVQRHCVDCTKYHGLDKHTAVDELVHEEYWKKIGFEDPYSKNKDKLRLFRQCNVSCSHPSHKEKKSYCLHDIWHGSLKDNPTAEHTIADGHHFGCQHPKPPHMYVNSIFWLKSIGI